MQHQPLQNTRRMRILLVAENVSLRLSGETILPYHYLIEFLEAGHEVWVLCHMRVREGLERDLAPDLFVRVRFITDDWLQRRLSWLENVLPHRVQDLAVNQLIQLLTQFRVRSVARAMIAEFAIDIVFQPTPIAAKSVSALVGLGRPVVIGPMSGGMELPPAFRSIDGPWVALAVKAARASSMLLHQIIPGKRQAAALIVANARTRAALPKRVRGRIHHVMESAVDLRRWQERVARVPAPDGIISFIFCGRFVDWKGIGYLVRAFAPLAREGGVRLDLVGDGELFDTITQQVQAANLTQQVVLHGRLSNDDYVAMLQSTDVFVTPSLRECGGIAMMEAMAIGLPVIGVDWAGAAQYAGPDCAILVPPTSEQALIDGLTVAMRTLATDAALRAQLGAAGRRHLEVDGRGWDTQAARVSAILADEIVRFEAASARSTPVPPSPLSSFSRSLDHGTT